MTVFTPKSSGNRSKPSLFQVLLISTALGLRELSDLLATSSVSVYKPGLVEIEQLVELLARHPNVEAVRAIAHKPGSLHEITIEVLSFVDTAEQRKLREKAIELATEAEWKLSDLTQTEDWYFDARVTKRFSRDLGQAWLVTSKNAESQRLSTAG